MTEKQMKELEKTHLYSKWRRALKQGCCEEWKSFRAFYAWAEKSGFQDGDVLKRKNIEKPYSPKNCSWIRGEKTKNNFPEKDFCKKWNETVNRIRVQCGMEPFHVEEAE